MRREWHEVRSSGREVPGAVISYGHWGRPLLAFPAEQGSASDFERHGMVDSIADLIDAGRVKLYCADSFDGGSWARYDLPLEERAQRHGQYESWVIDEVVPYLRGDAVYFNSPGDYVANADGGHLDWLRSQVSIVLVVGQGAWETDPTGALPSTRRLAALLQGKGIRCELDLWGDDVAHDWPWWCRQLAHHLPRFC